MGKSKKKYDSSSSSSSSDASDSSDTSSSEDLEVQRRSKKKKSSGSSSRKHKKSTVKSHAGSELDSASEQSSNEGAKVATVAKKKHKKHKKQKKAKKHKKHKTRGESEDEKRATVHDDDEEDIEEIIEEVIPDRRHRTISSDGYGKDRDTYGSRVVSSVKRGSMRDDRSSVDRDRNRGRDRSATSSQKHPSSKWDSPADGGEYRRKRSHSPRESSGNFRSGQRGNFDEYRKAPKSPPPARESPAREYERGGRPLYHGRGGRGGGGRYDERPSPHQEGRRWGGDRYEDDRHGGRVDDFRKPPNMRRFDNDDRRFDGNRRGSHQHQHSQQRERYDDFSGRDRNPRPRNNRDDYEDRGGGGPRRRNSSPMGAPPPRGGRDRSPMQQHEFRNDFGGGHRGGYRDRYDGHPQHMERGRFNRRGSFNRGGRGRRGYHQGGSDRESFHGGSDREMDHRKQPSGWGRRSPPPSPRGSPSRSRSRERGGSDRNGGRTSRSASGRDRISSPPPIKIERRESLRSTSGSPVERGGSTTQRQRKFPRKEEKDDDAEFEWGAKRKQPKREQDFRGSSEESGPSDKAKEDKEKPNFGLSGKLTEEANKVNGVVIKYAEPTESRKPKRRWRLYPFKGEQALPTLYIHRQSCYLIGRDRKVCDLPIDHPSCSKQHAALQYRLVPYEREDGTAGKRVRPYIIDLESANGTFVNNKKIETKKYVELLEKDVLKFGFSSREYVLLHENSKEDEEDDDVVDEKSGSGGGAAGGTSNGGGISRNKREASE